MWGKLVQRWSRGGVCENDSVFSKIWPTKTLRYFVKVFQILYLDYYFYAAFPSYHQSA